jgi:hypothetical protein
MCRSLRIGCGAVSGCIGLLVQCRRVAAALGRCACVVVCVDARDARGCASTLRLGCQTPSCCCSACGSLAAFTRCLQLLCCCCLPCACLHVHGIDVCRAVMCATVAVSLRCRVGRRRQVPGGCLVVSFWGHSHTVLSVSDSMQCADWLSFDLT